MDPLFLPILNLVLSGGTHAIIAILAIIILLQLYDRRRLIADIAHKDEVIEKNTDNYHNDTMKLTEAINALKFLLLEMRTRI